MKSITSKVNNYLDTKHENFILDVISQVLLGVWVAGFLMLGIGFLFNASLPFDVGVVACIGCSGWERVMAYLTWRSD